MRNRMLIAYSMASTHVPTTLDYLLMLQEHLKFDANFVHATHDAELDVDVSQYDVIFNNYCVRHCFEGYVSQSYRDALKRFNGVKVLAVQDEYDNTNRLKAAIKEHGFDIVLTCVPQSSLDYVYPRAEFPNVKFLTVFTGYVSDHLLATHPNPKPLVERNRFIGYRGRNIGGRYGRLGYDKYEIGRRMKQECDDRGISSDIAVDEESRIYGPAWFDFIEDCRAMLGSESGSNIFDFDGTIDQKFKAMTAANGGSPPSYQEFAPFVADHEMAINMGQISPRVFECAALKTPMVLYRGRYSDAIEPDKHYIALEKDFSNVEEVLERLKNVDALQAMAERAYDHLIASGAFTYSVFCTRVREAIDERRATKLTAKDAAGSQPALVRIGRDSVRRALLERTTDKPLGMAEFEDRQRKLSRALMRRAVRLALFSPKAMLRSAVASSVALVQGSKIVRGIWYRIPRAMRFQIRQGVNRVLGGS